MIFYDKKRKTTSEVLGFPGGERRLGGAFRTTASLDLLRRFGAGLREALEDLDDREELLLDFEDLDEVDDLEEDLDEPLE